ncbi:MULTISPECIES: MFS transporter [Streptomyces]|uniref:MFS transporter n=1 Tax=Streptomyces TaxID=1883 RepID=UPI00099E0AE6|nr:MULTISPECIES: MFS transporter [Streptomyces]MBD3556971.1 MFS transporter [Streptomyces sp. SP18CM02]
MRKRYSLRRYLVGAVVARAGDEMAGPALMLAGFAVAGSSVEASSLLAGITLSAAVGGPLLGALLDRAARPGRLLAGALVLYAAGLGAILAGLGRLPFAVTVLIAAVTGLAGPALSGGWTAQLPGAVPGDRLPRANALDAMTFSAAALTGPALAGGVAEVAGAPWAVVASVMLVALALPAAWTLPARPPVRPTRAREEGAAWPVRPARPDVVKPPGHPARERQPGRSARTRGGRGDRGTRTASMAGDLLAGVRIIVARPALARATLASTVSCVAQGMLTACVPLLGERVLGGAGRGAALLSCAAVSALLATAVLARFPRALAPGTVIWAGALVQAAALASAATGSPLVLVVAFLATGCAEGPQLAALFTVRHREAPERLRGQVFTTGASVKITGFAVGAATAGPLATRSLPAALLLAAAVAAAAAPAYFAIRADRRPHLRTEPHPTGSPGCRPTDCSDRY